MSEKSIEQQTMVPTGKPVGVCGEAAADPKLGLTAEIVNSQPDWAKMRLREEIATANYSNEAGVQVLLEADPQILKAIDSMPQATELAAMLKRT